ncbi:MAG: LacI family DNA-binding transcriptional regulator [Planctomycetota bacterium]
MQDKKVTIQDIAKQANVSKSTVSRVLNNSSLVKDAKRAAVLEAMELLDFQPNQVARSLAGGKSMAIGIVTHDIGSPFYDAVAHAANNELRTTPYSPIFADGQWNPEAEEAAIDTLLSRRVDGIVLIGGTVSPEILHRARQQKPIVVVVREIPEWDENCIFIDNFKGAYDATQYLIESGHREIAFISGIINHQDAIRRKEGFLKALEDAGISANPKLFFEGDFRPKSGVAAAEQLLQSNEKFTAIFASNDEMAFGARLTLYRKGINVPDDVSIIGFDDQPMSAFMTPPMTTVRQPALELGQAAIRAIISQLADEPIEKPELKPELIRRESVRVLN